jgi:hypothetical protein
MSKWRSIGGVWISERGGLSISVKHDELPEADQNGNIRMVAFKNNRKEGKQPDYRVLIKEGDDK